MSTIPIFNPQSPFLGLIPGGLKIGQTLRIRVTISNFNSRCHINIQSGAALRPRDDTVLHLSIRPQENCIIRNHLSNQIWGQEERHGGMPIQWQESFEISITPEGSFFKILLNGNHFCTFNYRLPVSMAQFVSIDGGCSIQYINLDDSNESYSTGAPYIVQPVPITAAPIPILPAPGYPQHHVSYPPAPPPMPPAYTPPPPYGQYPTPYMASNDEKEKKKEKNTLKVAAGVGAVAGLTAVAVSSASRGLRRHRK